MAYIAIEWISGRPHKDAEEDERRASDAAEAVLDAAGVDYVEASKAYQAQWLEFDDEAPMTGLALVWIKARESANLALTEGWHDPSAGWCDIVA